MMQHVHFYKYQGAGNDFIIIDNRDGHFNVTDAKILNRLCDRRFGIGADGIMLLKESGKADFEMDYYNADGRLGSLCGNGGRCIVAFAKRMGLIDSETAFLAADGIHQAQISAEGNWVSLHMMNVGKVNRDEDAFVIDTGSPHFVKRVTDLANLNVYEEGKKIRNSEPYRIKGINVNFVEEEADGYFVRTYERGVEDETLACGTGVTAVALAMASYKKQEGSLSTPIRVAGGQLKVSFQKEKEIFSHIILEGPATFVFEGDIQLDAYS
ncbi:diaminopimelate epimerase [bacterium A37T11]|nr:diaminopimelate epimerase [bacterium A37T11]